MIVEVLIITVYVTKVNLAVDPKDYMINMDFIFLPYHPWYFDI